MKLKQLRSAEITTIYQERMVHDFIRDELKQLPVILKAVDDGIYECPEHLMIWTLIRIFLIFQDYAKGFANTMGLPGA